MGLLERDHFLAMLRDCPPGHVILVTGEAKLGVRTRREAARHGATPLT